MRKVISVRCQDLWVYSSWATWWPCDSISLPVPHSVIVSCPLQRWCWEEEKIFLKEPWLPAKTDEGRWDANGRQGSQREMNCTENPRISLFQGLPVPSLAWLPLLHALVHPLMETTTCPKHSKARQQVEREGNPGVGRLRDKDSLGLHALHGACNPVFWERDLKREKSTWYAAFWEWIQEGRWDAWPCH